MRGSWRSPAVSTITLRSADTSQSMARSLRARRWASVATRVSLSARISQRMPISAGRVSSRDTA